MRPTARETAEPHDYVILSDLHLGSDLVEHARPWSRSSWLSEQAEIDDRLESAIVHHAVRAQRPVRFVFAGDFIDFIGMSLPPSETLILKSGLTAEERAHGLGSAADHSALKVFAVARRHPAVFRALAQALEAGHSIVIVRGNHDMEWHWGSTRRAFVEAVCAHVSPAERAAAQKRIEFRLWFYHVPGLFYVEHGHEFDPMCSYGDPLLPLCPRDPRRIRATASDVLLRYVARPTRGLSTFGHENANFLTYVRMATSFGVVGGLQLFARFARASWRLFHGLLSTGAREAVMEKRSAQRMRALGRKHLVCEEVLHAIRAMHVRPVARSLVGLLRSLYWDRISLGALVILAWLVMLSSTPYRDAVRWSLVLTMCAAFVGFLVGRGRDIDPSARMRASAREIARRLGVRFVIMGHTHEPQFVRLDAHSHYVNLGNWGMDELPEDRLGAVPAAPSTFLRLVHTEHGYRAALCAWHTERGARVVAEEQRFDETESTADVPRLVETAALSVT